MPQGWRLRTLIRFCNHHPTQIFIKFQAMTLAEAMALSTVEATAAVEAATAVEAAVAAAAVLHMARWSHQLSPQSR